jgi:(p)ppGpp synthase/HD superfamily hydrolase
MGIQEYGVSKDNFLKYISEQAKLRIDDYLLSAIEVAEEVHSGLKREDGFSSFLETHIWPVTIDVVKHYKLMNRNITSVEIASAILHDILEDNDRILDWYQTKSYGFEAYLHYRFGKRIYEIATKLKVRPMENYPGFNAEERELNRFQEYRDILTNAEYDIKTIKLSDRINNMRFIIDRTQLTAHAMFDKTKRYLRESEDFYLCYTMLPPKMPDYYRTLRKAYEELRSIYYRQIFKSD